MHYTSSNEQPKFSHLPAGDYPGYQLKIPKGKRELFAAEYAKIPENERYREREESLVSETDGQGNTQEYYLDAPVPLREAVATQGQDHGDRPRMAVAVGNGTVLRQ